MSEPSLFDALQLDTLQQVADRQAVVNRQRDDAMRQIAQHAEERRQDFARQARVYIVQYLEAHGPTAGEVLTAACKAAGIRPHDDRAFGPVYMTLARRGVIEKVGSVRRELGHGTAGGNIWGLVR